MINCLEVMFGGHYITMVIYGIYKHHNNSRRRQHAKCQICVLYKGYLVQDENKHYNMAQICKSDMSS